MRLKNYIKCQHVTNYNNDLDRVMEVRSVKSCYCTNTVIKQKISSFSAGVYSNMYNYYQIHVAFLATAIVSKC